MTHGERENRNLLKLRKMLWWAGRGSNPRPPH